MSSQSDHEPRRIQRAKGARSSGGPGHDAVPGEALTEFENSKEAKRLQRMVDQQIVEKLRSVGFDKTTRDWREFVEALVEYGYAVLVAWGVTDQIATKVRTVAGRSGSRVPERLRLPEDDARGLAHELLVVSIENFRTKSLRRWTPTGGASLRTFFIGRCLLDFADVYGSWYRRERRPLPLAMMVDDGRHCDRPDEHAEACVVVDELLGGDPILRKVLELQRDGFTLDEIAKKLGKTEAGVRTLRHRALKRLNKPEDSDG